MTLVLYQSEISLLFKISFLFSGNFSKYFWSCLSLTISMSEMMNKTDMFLFKIKRVFQIYYENKLIDQARIDAFSRKESRQ